MFLPDLGRGEGCMGSSNVLAQNSGAVLEYDLEASQSSTLNSQLQRRTFILPVVSALAFR